MIATDVAVYGDQVAAVLGRALGTDLVGVYVVGSVALGGYVPGESDIDIAAVTTSALTDAERRMVASAVVDVTAGCPARGLELTLYRREVVRSSPADAEVEVADFEVNANGGPRMPSTIQLDATVEPGFWYVLDRAVAHRAGVAIAGPAAHTIFADVPRSTLVKAMIESMAWHREHEKASLYSVLNACRAWRFAEEDVLGSKLEGAAWARVRWPDHSVIDAAVARRRGRDAELDGSAVDALLSSVAIGLREATGR